MRLFIANPTTQNHDFLYPVVPGKPARKLEIPAGGQAMIPLDLRQEDIEAIVRQHMPFGLFPVETLDGLREKAWLIASIDKPVSAAVIGKTIERNKTFDGRQSEDQRVAALASAANGLQDFANRQQLPTRKLEALDVETIEDQRGRVVDGDGPAPAPFNGPNVKIDMNEDRARAAGGRGRRR